jgi:hypothetical protein
MVLAAVAFDDHLLEERDFASASRVAATATMRI